MDIQIIEKVVDIQATTVKGQHLVLGMACETFTFWAWPFLVMTKTMVGQALRELQPYSNCFTPAGISSPVMT